MPLQCTIASDLFGDPTRTCTGAFINVLAACKPVPASCGTVAGSKKPARGSHDFSGGFLKATRPAQVGVFSFFFFLSSHAPFTSIRVESCALFAVLDYPVSRPIPLTIERMQMPDYETTDNGSR